MFIDIHTHAFHPKIAHKAVAQLENHYSIPSEGTGDLQDLQARIAKAGIDRAVVLTAATAPSQVIPANNWAIQIKETCPNCIPFGTAHPGFDRLEVEFDRLERAGIKGLKFHPDFQGFRMDDRGMYEIMEMAANRFICLFHVGDKLPPDQNPSCPKKMAALHRAFPDTKIIAAHMGGLHQWDYSLEYLADTEVFIDTSSSMDFLDDDMFRKLVSAFGTERLLFGSDYPLYDPATERERLEKILKLPDAVMEHILGGNAVALLSDKPKRRSDQINDGAEVRIKQPLVGSDHEPVGHAG
ncbi:amidohydrolase family protein [Pseudodesulfovibrio sp.]|uniref:amidohydrolase family protein n=1 Tax=unclassified Pseudodesulfovibrio TaxID=2661612 RepID=UPI003B008A18